MIELELTYLAKKIPEGLNTCPSKKIVDMYIENGTGHADLRVRQNGEAYEITRKHPVDDGDASKQIETTIPLKHTEFESFSSAQVKKIAKTRYFYEYNNHTAEFDIFEDELAGLVLVDFEFDDEMGKDDFTIPDFCLADITQEIFIAGGILAGKSYGDIAADLERFAYKKLSI